MKKSYKVYALFQPKKQSVKAEEEIQEIYHRFNELVRKVKKNGFKVIKIELPFDSYNDDNLYLKKFVIAIDIEEKPEKNEFYLFLKKNLNYLSIRSFEIKKTDLNQSSMKSTSNTDLNNIWIRNLSLSIGSLVNLSKFTEHYTHNSNKVEAELNFRRKKIIFRIEKEKKQYSIESSFSSIKTLYIETELRVNKMETTNFYIKLKYPPLLYEVMSDRKLKKKKFKRVEPWEFFETSDQDLFQMALTYKISENQSSHLEPWILLSQSVKNESFALIIGKSIEKTRPDRNFLKIQNLIDSYFHDDINLSYACLALFSTSYQISDSLDMKVFLEKVQELCQENKEVVADCLYDLKQLSIKHFINFHEELVKNFRKKMELKLKSEKTKNYIIIKSAILTPTKLEFCLPIPLLTSRFSEMADIEYAINVTVMDDDGETLNGNDRNTNIKYWLVDRLAQGFHIGDFKFDYLGSSCSQMREGGVIFYSRDNQNQTAQKIRENIGTFPFDLKLSKYMARLGLAFSQAIYIYKYDTSQVFPQDDYPDIKTIVNRKEYTFSDGIGMISKNLAQQIHEFLSEKRKTKKKYNYFPSAFQIRHGGCKGMLVWYPKMKDNQILIRDSMKKFHSDDKSLGILKYSFPRKLYWNKPFASIVEQHQLPLENFYQYFSKELRMISNALFFEQRSQNLLDDYSIKFIPYGKLIKFKISISNDHFLKKVLEYLAMYRLNELKHRARISVPINQGRCAFGILDETETLEPGQIFFQYTKLKKNGEPNVRDLKVLKGEVMITKFPCIGLGDVRKVEAVDVENLRHIKDCVVFSAKGDRPLPDMMAGSDLDGDEYAIIWKKNLIFPGENKAALEFSSENEKKSKKNHKTEQSQFTVKEMADFFITFLMECSIQKIATSHLIHADFIPKGLESEKCKKLAEDYSLSVDFQKSGINKKLEDNFQIAKHWLRPDFSPSFNYENNQYLSSKVLGQLYRLGSLIEQTIELSRMKKNENLIYRFEPKFVRPGFEEYKLQAIQAYEQYCYRIRSILEQLDLESEIALLTNVYKEKQDADSVKIEDFRKEFSDLFEKQKKDLDDGKSLDLASAWYKICYEMSDQTKYHYREQPLFGLPWLIGNKMKDIAEMKSSSNPVVQFPQIHCDKIEKMQLFNEHLLAKWRSKIDEHIFQKKQSPIIYLKFEQSQINIEQIWRNFIQVKTKNLIDEFNKDTKGRIFLRNEDTEEKMIIFLLMFSLNELSSNIYDFIINENRTNLQNIFFIKYALYSLASVDILKNLMDKVSYEKIDQSSSRIIENELDNFFLGSIFQPMEESEFNVLENEFCHLKEITQQIDKIKFLTGVKKIFCSRNNDQIEVSNETVGQNLKDSGIQFFKVKAKGNSLSLKLLKLFLGHPQFYQKVLSNFDIFRVD